MSRKRATAKQKVSNSLSKGAKQKKEESAITETESKNLNDSPTSVIPKTESTGEEHKKRRNLITMNESRGKKKDPRKKKTKII